MRNPVSAGCLKAYTNQNILFLLYALKLDTELLTDEALTAFQLANERKEKERFNASPHAQRRMEDYAPRRLQEDSGINNN